MSYDDQNGRDRQRSDSSQPYKRKRIITKSNDKGNKLSNFIQKAYKCFVL